MGVRRGRASFVKDGSIFKRARAAAACSGAAQAGGGDVTVSRRSFCHRSGGGEVAVHTFTPRRYLGGGGAFFYLAGLLAYILLLPLFALLLFILLFLFLPLHLEYVLRKRLYSSIHFHGDPLKV